jgi:ribosomal protein S18 acetylase RimI-like enzyme
MDKKFIFKTTTKTGKTVSFRYPTMGDLQIITNFINKASKEKTFITFQGEILKLADEKKWLEATIKKIKNKEKVYLMAFIENNFAGSSDIELSSLIRKHIGTFGIIIDNNYRGEGVGNILMDLVIKEAIKNIKDLKKITLEVMGDNSIAQGLYKKMGFVEYGRLPKGLKHKDNFVDEILMYKKIK